MVKFRRTSDIRWYLYQSRTKLSMLFDQLVSSSGPFVGGLTFEIPGIKAALNTSRDEPLTYDEKLEVVEKELRARGLVGTIHEPREYFGGEMPMRWGLFNDQGSRPADDPPLVFFGGLEKDDGIVVGLGGSSKHVIGHEGASSTYSRSTTPVIVAWLLAGLNDTAPPSLWGDADGEQQEVLSSVSIALHYLRPPTQRLRFLAKTLLSGTVFGHEHFTGLPEGTALLGTPLYVAMTEPPPNESRWGLDDQW